MKNQIKKITIEYVDSNKTEIELSSVGMSSISMFSGISRIPGISDEVEMAPNGLRVFSLLVGPEFVVDELQKYLSNEIPDMINIS